MSFIRKKYIGIVIEGVFLLIVGFAAYSVGRYSHCPDAAALDSMDTVTVTAIDGGYFACCVLLGQFVADEPVGAVGLRRQGRCDEP